MRAQLCGVSKQIHSFFTSNNLSNACLQMQRNDEAINITETSSKTQNLRTVDGTREEITFPMGSYFRSFEVYLTGSSG